MANDRLANDRLANDRLANDRLANDRLANDRLANDRLANDRLANDRLANDEETPKPEEFVVAFNVLDFNFDPHHSIYSAEAQVFTAAYEGLFSYDPNTLDRVKAACRSYSRSQDGKTYTFYIRDEASWSDGSPLLARDFRDAWLGRSTPGQRPTTWSSST